MVVNGELIIRLDDIRCLSARLERVWRVLENHGVPVHLGVIPADLERGEAKRLLARARRSRSPVSVQQHGFRHVNHGKGKRRFEFGDDRSLDEQRADILAGRRILEQHLEELFEPVFVPPWDRLGASTLEILAQERYLAVSIIDTSASPEDGRVPRVSMTTDPVRWRPSPVHKPWDETYREITAHLARKNYAGIELHHEVMDDRAVTGLDRLLGRLQGIRLPTMRVVAEQMGPSQ